MSDLYRLVYTSFRKPECDEQEIENILKACRKNNPKRDVTGILLHSKSRFIQYVEGKKENVEELYNKILDDPRHTSISKRNFEPIDERVFPSWEMGYKDVDGVSFQTAVSEEDKKTFKQLLEGDLDFGNNAMRVLQLFFKN